MTLHVSQNQVFADKSQTLTTVKVGGQGVPGNTALLLEAAAAPM